MIKWIFTRRFNYVDSVSMGISLVLFNRQEFLISAIVFFLGVVISAIGERFSK